MHSFTLFELGHHLNGHLLESYKVTANHVILAQFYKRGSDFDYQIGVGNASLNGHNYR